LKTAEFFIMNSKIVATFLYVFIFTLFNNNLSSSDYSYVGVSNNYEIKLYFW
jgi:hypothetical protein